MSVWQIITIILLVILAVLVVLYFVGRRMQKKQAEASVQMEAMKQTISMLIIDKKKLRMKESGLPQQVIDQTPRFARLAKVPVVKAKVGPQIVTLIADNQIYDQIPVKKEVKASLSGLFISDVRGVRGPLEKPEKKRGFFAKLTGQK